MRNPINTAFLMQLHHAKQRGIEFKFTFEEWCAWWEANLGPDWFEKRGRNKGQFVMARLGDKGAYERSNVKCVTTEQNTKEKTPRTPKLSDLDIIQIYQSKSLQKDLAATYAVSERLIRLIKNKQTKRSQLLLFRSSNASCCGP